VPEVLDESALVPRENLVSRAPARFTHEVVRATAFRYSAEGRGRGDGRFEAGTRVMLVSRRKTGRCRVIDGRGLSVWVACRALRVIGRD
jgi:hypothetical protein